MFDLNQLERAREIVADAMPPTPAPRNSARSTYSSAPASSKPVAKPSSVPAANSPACSGQYAAQTPSSLSAAADSTDALKTTGENAERLDLHFYVAHPLLDTAGPTTEQGRMNQVWCVLIFTVGLVWCAKRGETFPRALGNSFHLNHAGASGAGQWRAAARGRSSLFSSATTATQKGSFLVGGIRADRNEKGLRSVGTLRYQIRYGVARSR